MGNQLSGRWSLANWFLALVLKRPPLCPLHPSSRLVLVSQLHAPWCPVSSLRIILVLSLCVLSCFSCVRLFCDPMDCSLSGSSALGFSRQEYWSWLQCPHPGHHPNPGIEPTFLMSPELAGKFFTTSTTWATRAVLNLA